MDKEQPPENIPENLTLTHDGFFRKPSRRNGVVGIVPTVAGLGESLASIEEFKKILD